MNSPLMRALAAGLALLAAPAWAHTGHGAEGLMQGLAHPFAWDHALVMAAVGLWAACALPRDRRWTGPAVFVTLLAAAAGLALWAGATATPVALEHALLMSVALCGALVAVGPRLPVSAGLALVALAAMGHGWAHGAEAPAGTQALAYGLGFVLSSAALHAAGLLAGAGLQRHWPQGRAWVGAALGLGGLGWLLA